MLITKLREISSYYEQLTCYSIWRKMLQHNLSQKSQTCKQESRGQPKKTLHWREASQRHQKASRTLWQGWMKLVKLFQVNVAIIILCYKAGANPGFPRVGAPTYNLAKFSPKKCMKMKKIGLKWGGGGRAHPNFDYVDSPQQSNRSNSVWNLRFSLLASFL